MNIKEINEFYSENELKEIFNIRYEWKNVHHSNTTDDEIVLIANQGYRNSIGREIDIKFNPYLYYELKILSNKLSNSDNEKEKN